jgi:hypothetical protein
MRRVRVLGEIDRRGAVALGSIVAILAIQLIGFSMPLGNWARGGILGLLNAMLAVGIALIYRANRVVNFAQADLGSVPGAFAWAIILFWNWPYQAVRRARRPGAYQWIRRRTRRTQGDVHRLYAKPAD